MKTLKMIRTAGVVNLFKTAAATAVGSAVAVVSLGHYVPEWTVAMFADGLGGVLRNAGVPEDDNLFAAYLKK
jgi:hypothetical protein